jgi:hypothetical protein
MSALGPIWTIIKEAAKTIFHLAWSKNIFAAKNISFLSLLLLLGQVRLALSFLLLLLLLKYAF